MNSRFDELYDKFLLNDLSYSEENEFIELFKLLNRSEKKEYQELFNLFQSLSFISESKEFEQEKIKSKLLKTIKNESNNNVKNIDFTIRNILIAAVILLSLSSLILFYQIDSKNNRLELLNTEVEKRETVMKVMLCKEMTIYRMKAQFANSMAYGKVAWSPLYKVAVLQICNLPELPDDKDYQLWVINDDEGINNLGTINSQSTIDENFYKINDFFKNDLKHIKKFAITIEAKGGNTKPSESMALLSI
jgi:hypothetical protein